MTFAGLPLSLAGLLGKPMMIVAAIGGVYGFGFMQGRSADSAAELRAENTALRQEVEARDRIAERARAAAADRQNALDKQTKWIEQYAMDLRDRADRCSLQPDDIDRLRQLSAEPPGKPAAPPR